jgi:hypothetical protein
MPAGQWQHHDLRDQRRPWHQRLIAKPWLHNAPTGRISRNWWAIWRNFPPVWRNFPL